MEPHPKRQKAGEDPDSVPLDRKRRLSVDISKMTDASEVEEGMTPAVLISCGSFSPPTVLHCRIFEAARDYFRSRKQNLKIQIIGGFMSPVHDGYGKKSLVSATDRVDMCYASLASSDWVAVDKWEVEQNEWTRTKLVLKRFREELNKDSRGPRIRVMFLCGADILESMNTPGVWKDEDLKVILGDGIACIRREGSDPESLIAANDKLSEFQDCIYLVQDPVPNTVSSTAVRRALQQGQSIKYLVSDGTEKIIRERGLYSSDTST